MADSLVFSRKPLGGPPNVLVFGEPDDAIAGAAQAFGALALPVFAIAGLVAAALPTPAAASGHIALPAFVSAAAVSGVVRYGSATSRPLVREYAGRWASGASASASVRTTQPQARPVDLRATSQSRKATAIRAAFTMRTAAAAAARLAPLSVQHQSASKLAVSPTTLRNSDAMTVPGVAAVVFHQEAAVLGAAPWTLRQKDALCESRASADVWQAAMAIARELSERAGQGAGVETGWTVRHQWAMVLPPGSSAPVVQPPAVDPCYLPDTQLVFADRAWSPATRLIFLCERHGGATSTLVIPILRTYLVQNHIALERVDGGAAIEADAFAMNLDTDSWTWSWSASVPRSALPLLAPESNGDPAGIRATVNGIEYRLCAERYSRSRRFGETRVHVEGRGRAAVLDAPYAPQLNHLGAQTLTAQQLLAQALTINGVGIGWGVAFGLDDWSVPAGTWTLQGTYIEAVLDIAQAAGGIVQPDRTARTLRVLPRYFAAPWDWEQATPDVQIPADVASVEGIEWKSLADYSRVFVAGTTGAGILGQVTRGGTAGDQVAPMVTHPLITHAIAARQRGRSILSNTGRQAIVTLSMPVLPDSGVIEPNTFVRYVDGGESRLGIVRSTALSWQRPVLRQSLAIETHL